MIVPVDSTRKGIYTVNTEINSAPITGSKPAEALNIHKVYYKKIGFAGLRNLKRIFLWTHGKNL
jgi:hypothetical protein